MQSCDARRWNYIRCLVASQRCRLATLLASTLPKFCLDSRTEVLVDEKLWILLLAIDILHQLHRMMKTSSTILSRMERTLEIGRFTCVWYFMICLWWFWSWTFVYHCETSPSMMKTQMLSRRPKWFLQGSCWWMNSDSHWNTLQQDSWWFQWIFTFTSTWEDHLFQAGWTHNLYSFDLGGKKIQNMFQAQIEKHAVECWSKFCDDTMTSWRKRCFCWIPMAIRKLNYIQWLYIIKLGIVPSTFLHNHNNNNKKSSSSKLQSCCFGLRETGSLRNGAIAIKAQISWLESTLFGWFGACLVWCWSCWKAQIKAVFGIFVVGVKDHVASI